MPGSRRVTRCRSMFHVACRLTLTPTSPSNSPAAIQGVTCQCVGSLVSYKVLSRAGRSVSNRTRRATRPDYNRALDRHTTVHELTRCQRSGLSPMVDPMAACTHSQVHAMAHATLDAAPPAPDTETIAAPSPVYPRIGRTHPADAPNTYTHDRQSTPWLYSPLNRRAEFIGSGCD